jgi:hypothetical protein
MCPPREKVHVNEIVYAESVCSGGTEPCDANG